MGAKRKARDEDPTAITGREKKKQRTNIARNIEVQSPHGSIPNSMSGMPSTIDVEKFIEVSGLSRICGSPISSCADYLAVPSFRDWCHGWGYEISPVNHLHPYLDVLKICIAFCRANATQRVWQTLPRHLRRRAASHDFRRVPVRLRMKAKLEVNPLSLDPAISSDCFPSS